ncbi:mannose-1-phosphate guanylyltransferase [Rhizobium mongolense subsp. loessense]|uniref:Mannose-1-phosphate guanylyltransferase n=1 Tax=Rhizobium mongolense subsp. loessense TaxID=158890 RepID=A0A1G4RWY0_9HYPH|nr:mannose-1-phosphate guanylyltransferase/mannose-6-phosphate isomerase [Rhizobium mongolense]SCW60985.1 mannose-1-phosphate guanylyltransferase [Rhizobium mongolense subsp. loessense]
MSIPTKSVKITPAIMIGGSGTRLWPLSRSNMPKQFLRLVDDRSLFQNTLARVNDAMFSAPWLLTSRAFIDMVNAQARQMEQEFAGIVLEPLQRGTAAALAAVAVAASEGDADALVLAMPADHVIDDPALFLEAVKKAVPLAESSKIVTFGIVPTEPETGFGYIRPGEPYVVDGEELGALVNQPGGFLEKPDLERAKQFVEMGYLWNAGIFLFRASALVEELKRHAPAVYEAVAASIAGGTSRDLGSHMLLMPAEEHFARCPLDIPIDTAVLEKSANVAVVPCDDIGWADIGSLSALWDISDKDENGNVLRGDSFVSQSRNCLVHAQSGRRVVLSHIEDIMVIDSEDAVVVLPKAQAQRVKEIVNSLKKMDAPEVSFTRSALKSWGAVKIDRSYGDSQVCAVSFQGKNSVTYMVSGAERETWLLHGDQRAEYGVDGHFTPFVSGNPVSFSRGQVVTIRNAYGLSEFTYVRKDPDLNWKIDDWFPQVAEVEAPKVRLG